MPPPQNRFFSHTLGAGSLKVKLIALVVLVALTTVIVLSTSLTLFTAARTSALLKDRAANLTTVVATLLSADVDFEQYDTARDNLSALSKSPGATYAAVYLADGTTVVRWGAPPKSSSRGMHALGADRTMSIIEDEAMLHIVAPVGTTDKTTLVIGFSRVEEQHERNAIAATSLLTALLLLPLLCLVGIWVASTMARPLLEMAATAEAIARGDRVALTQLPTERGDEAGKVARAFQQLLEQAHEGHLLLEARVNDRTTALMGANNQLNLRLGELAQAQEQLAASARAAGMAEIASGVLHNIGNVLNSVNVSAQLASDSLHNARLPALRQAVDLMAQHSSDLAALFASDKGPKLSEFLAMTSTSLEASMQRAIAELAGLRTNVDHINTLVATQQAYAAPSGFIESFKLADAVRAALHINFASVGREQVEVVQHIDDVDMNTDRHKMIQILVNLMTNARHAVKKGQQRSVEIVGRRSDGRVRIDVRDTGIGIDAETMGKLFRHGFTTKKDGHGFGLHASANSAKELGGSLRAESAGIGHGATFTLEIPVVLRADARDADADVDVDVDADAVDVDADVGFGVGVSGAAP